MSGLISEGMWRCRVEEKGRFLIPVKMRQIFRKGGTWAREPSGEIVLFPALVWKLKAIKVEDSQQFRETWKPFDMILDRLGRMTIPGSLRAELGREITLRPIEDYLKVRPANGDKPAEKKEPPELKELKCFKDLEEAKKYRDKGLRVIYFSLGGGKVTGKFDPEGGFFTFRGQNEKGIIISFTASYKRFYLGE